MNKDTTYYEELIGKYLSGEATSADISDLRTWLEEREENKSLFTQTRKAWALSEAVRAEKQIDLDEEWHALSGMVDLDQDSKVRQLTPVAGKNFLRVAAILLLFIIPSVLYFWFFMQPGNNVLIASGESIESTLPDGTQVALNTGSTLKYPSKFEGDQRKVSLKGEAYFDVTHNKEKPFVIDAGDMQIRVLGTTFYVNTLSHDNSMEVVLMSGSVKLSYAGKEMLLEPGEKAVVLKSHKEIVKQQSDDPNLLAWKTGILRFNDTPLFEIVETLKKVYQREIHIINPEVSGCRITATFEKQSLEAVLLVLQSTININVRPNGEVIEISGQACE
ncbi:MAG TPA: FecR domain-containing protein [Bacteroidales bacterium]|nr:FecR domain-containing protein [Bacteroidales bacterium]